MSVRHRTRRTYAPFALALGWVLALAPATCPCLGAETRITIERAADAGAGPARGTHTSTRTGDGVPAEGGGGDTSVATGREADTATQGGDARAGADGAGGADASPQPSQLTSTIRLSARTPSTTDRTPTGAPAALLALGLTALAARRVVRARTRRRPPDPTTHLTHTDKRRSRRSR